MTNDDPDFGLFMMETPELVQALYKELSTTIQLQPRRTASVTGNDRRARGQRLRHSLSLGRARKRTRLDQAQRRNVPTQ
jgi:hypothetical protein